MKHLIPLIKRTIPHSTIKHNLLKMNLLKEQRILELIEDNKNINVIYIKTTTENFKKRFDNNTSNFWKKWKNGLYSLSGRTNREVMKGMNGFYLSLQIHNETEILIFYQNSKFLNKLDTSVRLKKLFGLNTKIEFGTYNDYELKIKKMTEINKSFQPFGEFYHHKQYTKTKNDEDNINRDTDFVFVEQNQK